MEGELLAQSTEYHSTDVAILVHYYSSKYAMETLQVVSARSSQIYELVHFGLSNCMKLGTFVEYELGKSK